MNNAFNMLCN